FAISSRATSSRCFAMACNGRWPCISAPTEDNDGHPAQPKSRSTVPGGPGNTRARARLYASVKDLPIVSPHGHTDPQWFADDAPFANASALLITPDHYVFRMLYSQGVRLDELGIPHRDKSVAEHDARKIWKTFAAHYH